MRIDSHVYVSASHPPEHLESILKRNKFDSAVFVADGSLPAGSSPLITAWVARGGPLDGAALDSYQQDSRFRGVCGSLEQSIPAAAELARRGIPLDVEMRPADFPALLRLVEDLPTLRVAIDHLARPDFGRGMSEDWARGMEAAARFPTVYCKISGLLAETVLPWSAAPIKPFVQQVLGVFGPSRLMFGSEWPVRLPEVIWKESLAAFTQSIGAQSMEIRERLLGGTAAEFYGI